jgi:protoporphyrin/coproporphyrin ferrochelatase
MSRRTALLCMAYGAPRDESEVEAYYTHIRGGRPPSPEALEDLLRRYRAIGGSPLEQITRRQAAVLGARLAMRSLVGMKHASPFIADAVGEARAEGYERLVALPLAPHFARMSVGGYERAIRETWDGDLECIAGFSEHPAFISAAAGLLREALRDWTPERVFFTAHSLPERIVREGDRYDERLLESARMAAEAAALEVPWEVAYQSQSTTGEPWLGPDLLETIERSGALRVLVCPIGFVADHLEILYDLDVEAREFARERSIELRRTPMFNDRPEFVEALAEVVEDRLHSRV